MLDSSLVFILAQVLLAGPAVAHPCVTVRHIEIPERPAVGARPVCISPGQTTVFSFDAPLAPGSVTLEGVDGFTVVEPGASTLKVVPSEKVPLGKELRATVRFADDASPSSASFVLVAHVEQATSLVEVHRQRRTAESFRQELKAKDEQVHLCREEVTRLLADKDGLGGLRGLRASGFLGKEGIVSTRIGGSLTRHPTSPVLVGDVTAYRSTGRVALEFNLFNPEGAPTWMTEGTTLEGRQGVTLKVLPLWQEAPIAPGQSRFVMVEAEATELESLGPFTLKLWDAGGQRFIMLENVTFP